MLKCQPADSFSLWDPDAGWGFGGEGGEDDVPDAEAPEFAGDDGSVGHAAAWFDAGDQGRRPCRLRDRCERASCEGHGEGSRGYALPRSDAGEVREDFGTVDVFFVHRRAEGADV